MTPFTPANDIEVALVQAQRKEIPLQGFIAKLVTTDLALPSGREVLADGSGFQPVLFDKNGVNMVAVFTDKARVRASSCATFFCLTMNAMSLFKRMPREYGIVINPGFEAGLDISPAGIGEIVRDFSKAA